MIPIDPKWSLMVLKGPNTQMGANGCKWVQMGANDPKLSNMVQYVQKWFNMVQNCLK